VFYGHKFLLSTRSYWFDAAFTGEFQENQAKEITLHDDNANALEAMLHYLYHEKMKWTGSLDTKTYLLFCLDLYQVADKYGCPNVQGAAHSDFCSGFKKYWDKAAYHEAADGFREIVGKLYDGPQTTFEGRKSLLKVSLQTILTHRESQLNGPLGKLRPLILMTASEVAEFGQDILLHIMEQTGEQGIEKKGVTVELEFTHMVHCPDCDEVWMRPRCETDGHCWKCGAHFDLWDELEISG
jgi:hypothetical protein